MSGRSGFQELCSPYAAPISALNRCVLQQFMRPIEGLMFPAWFYVALSLVSSSFIAIANLAGGNMNLVEQALEAELPQLAMDFFVVFSRFECALKRSGTYAIGNDDRVDPDWDGFARDLGPDFLSEVVVQRIAPVLINHPPKKQVKLANGVLGWKDMGSVKNTADLFLALRRARNNLAHGAKYQDGGAGHADFVEGSERDDALLTQSLAVMALALKTRPDIYHFFRRY
ncbi:hypothetical protein [Pseudomonas viridiflava]|uniref:hypothetical protein n=1 Tax=Pseudomonas viridiflava TaxID=33069 RepID=UPI0013CEB233|nr:hypothetical protein [Pseudomonas viridiflava]